MSPLRQSMVNAMTVRGLSERTIECYTESISRLSRHYQGTNPARLTPQQIEAYLLHLVQDRKLSYSSVNHAASACRFLFETVLGRPNELRHLRPPMAKVPQRQPEMLSRQEISRLFEACPHPGHRMLLQTLYASGLRISEACQLQVGDIDSNPDRIGLLANPNGGQLAQAKAALHMPAPSPQAQQCAQDFMARVARVNIQQCPVCQRGRMGVVQTLAGAKRLPDPFERCTRKANSWAPQGP